MRVLYFSDNCSDHNRRFLEKLSQSGIEVWFLDPTSESVADNWLPSGVHWVRTRRVRRRDLDPSAFAGFLPEFQDCLQAIRPDLIHAGPVHNCGYLTALSHFHPWLLTSWGADILSTLDRSNYTDAGQLALSSADGFFCDCDAVRARAKQLKDLADDRIVQFPWGIRKGSFSPEGALPIEEESLVNLGRASFSAHAHGNRSTESMFCCRRFKSHTQWSPPCVCLLLGNGSEASQIREFITSHGLEHVVRVPGHVSRGDMPKWFRAVDVYVSCAKSDGTSVSLLEAMATGLPVVVADIPSNREWVVEAQNRWLAPSASVEEFANRFLLSARLSPEQRHVISQRNRRVVEERADWDRNFPMLLEMYKHLVSSQGSR